MAGSYGFPSPFATSFYVDTNAAACAPSCVVQFSNPGGAPFFGYANASISGLSTISLGGQTFSQANLVDTFGEVPVAFNQPLANGAAPLIVMVFVNSTPYALEFGATTCSPCSFVNPNPLDWGNFVRGDFGTPPFAFGTVTVRVTGFVGTPGSPQCHDQSTEYVSVVPQIR